MINGGCWSPLRIYSKVQYSGTVKYNTTSLNEYLIFIFKIFCLHVNKFRVL